MKPKSILRASEKELIITLISFLKKMKATKANHHLVSLGCEGAICRCEDLRELGFSKFFVQEEMLPSFWDLIFSALHRAGNT